MAAEIATLLQAAAALTPEELEDFYQRLSALRALTGPGEKPRKVHADALVTGEWAERTLYNAVTDQLLKALKRQPAPWVAFKHSPHYRKFCSVVDKLLQQHEQLCPGQDRLAKISMLLLYGRLAVDFIVEGRNAGHFQHAVFRDTLAALEDLTVLLDHHFPGYAQAGLIPKIAELRTNKRAPV